MILKRLVLLALALLLAACTTSSPANVNSSSGSPNRQTNALAVPSARPATAAPVAGSSQGPLARTGATAGLPEGTNAPAVGGKLPSFSHIFVIVMENREAGAVLGSGKAPYINELAAQYGYAANYHAIGHPSLPNYLSLIAGSTFGTTTDCSTCYVNSDNIAAQVQQAGKTWKAYIESLPHPCYLGADTSSYARRHNPFIYFDNIRTDPARCANDVPLAQLDSDLTSGQVPDFVWITPNLCDDMHDCPVGSGDTWLRTWVPKIMGSPAWKQDSVLFITFDEGTTTAGCCQYAAGGKVATLVISPLARKGFVSQVAYDHYSLLKTIEQAWGLPLLERAACDCTAAMTDFFEGD